MTNIKIQKYYQNKSRLNGVYAKDNLPDKIRDSAYAKNLVDFVLVKCCSVCIKYWHYLFWKFWILTINFKNIGNMNMKKQHI